ncbi:hypothetical protein H5410_056684 [Solanum commersonii]|uniref:Uncharacterized protein n=1 Tax=Solanum commersonii TaxID=4109 RepID=A0A9J5WNT4_SOLCO|nr:hypothetical protein H5410_056684 [Solanum commersonii]
MNIRQDYNYGAGCSRWENQPISKVNRSPKWVNPRFGDYHVLDLLVIQISDVIFPEIFCEHPSRPKLWTVHGSFGDPDFRSHFFPKNSWTSIKSLAMDRFVLMCKLAIFNVKQALDQISNVILAEYFVDVFEQLLDGADFRCQFCQKILWTCINTLAMEPVGHDGQSSPFSRSKQSPKQLFLDIRQDISYGASWSRRVNRSIFKLKRPSKGVNPSFCPFSCAIVHGSFGDLDFQ